MAMKANENRHPPPVTARPIFLSIPDIVVGMPVFLAKLRFACVMPNARFAEKDNPGIPVLVPLLLLAIFLLSFSNSVIG